MDIQYGVKITTRQIGITDYGLGILSGVIRWVTGRPALDGWKEGLIAKGSFSPVSQEIALARGGGYSTMSGFSLEIAPMLEGEWVWKRIKDLGLNLVQADAVLYCWRDGGQTEDWAGKVADTEAREDGFRIQFMDSFRAIHKPVLGEVFDSVRFPNAPESVRDKPIPVSIGRVGKSKLFPIVQTETYETVCINGLDVFDFAPCTNYTTVGVGVTSYRVVHLKTMDAVFTTNELFGKFLSAIKGGSESVRIIGNGASSSGVTLVHLESPLSNTPVFWSSTPGAHAADVWYFQISSLAVKYMASKNAIYEFAESSGVIRLFAYDSETKAFDSISDLLDESSESNIADTGYPGITILNKPANIEGDSQYYQYFTPASISELQEDTIGMGPISGTRPTPNTGAELANLRDRDQDTYYTWVADLGSGFGASAQLTIPIRISISPDLIKANFSNIYLAINQNTSFTGISAYHLFLNIKLVDHIGRETSALDDTSREIATNDIGDLNYIPWKYFGASTANPVFGNAKALLKINQSAEHLSSSKDLEIYPYAVLELIHEWTPSPFGGDGTMTLQFKEATLIGEKNFNLLKDNIYTDLTGDLFAGTWGGRKTAADPVLNIADAVEHLIRNYDEASAAIDTTSFDILSHATTGTRKDWTIGRQLTEEANSFDLCRELARFGMFGIVPRNNGTRALKAWMESDSPVAIHDEDVIDVGSIGSKDQTDLADLFNDLLIQFAWNPASEKFDRQYRITKIDENEFPALASPAWRTYAVGFTDAQYSLAADLWAKCHLSYERYGVIQTLPDELSKCYWFPDVVGDFGLTDANNAALKYLTEGARWWPFRKDIIPYSLPNTAEHAALELLDRITLNDAFATAGEDAYGWIVRKAIIPGTGEDGKDYIELALMLSPFDEEITVPPTIGYASAYSTSRGGVVATSQKRGASAAYSTSRSGCVATCSKRVAASAVVSGLPGVICTSGASSASMIDFTDGSLSSHLSGGATHPTVNANLLEASWTSNESYYGFTKTVSYTGEVFIKMDMKFGANFDFGQGQKILRVRAFNVGGGVNYWDFIVQITSVGSSGAQGGTTDSYQITVSRNGGSTWGTYNKTFTREQWYTFKYRFLLNSGSGVADGVFQMDLDGVQIFNITGLEMTQGATYDTGINRLLFGGWYSNGAGGNPDPDPDPGPNTLQFRNCYHSAYDIP